MEKNEEIYNITKNTLDKAELIINQINQKQIPIELILKYQLKIFFFSNGDKYVFNFRKDIYFAKIIAKMIDLLHLVFQMPESDREKFYDREIGDIIKNPDFFEIIDELDHLKSFNINFQTNKLGKLYSVISSSLYSKNEKISFSEYMDYLFFKLSFLPELNSLLKFQLYSIIINFYLFPMKVLLDFNEKNIIISDEIYLDLIIELFANSQNEFQSLVKSIIILNYGPISHIIRKYTLNEILSGIDSMFNKVKNIGNISICVEKIMMMFVDELNKQKFLKSKENEICLKDEIEKQKQGNVIKKGDNSKDRKNKKNKKNKRKKDEKEKSKKNIINARNKMKNNIDPNIESLNNYINNLLIYLDKNNMGNEESKKEVKNIQNLMLNIIDENSKMKIKMTQMEEEMSQMKEDMDEMKEEMDEMNNNIEDLTEDNNSKEEKIQIFGERINSLNIELKEIKEILGNIQCRDLSKAFLRSFGVYLTRRDWENIKNDRTLKGKIISKRIEELYPKANKKKMNLIKNLVEKSSELIQQGNVFAHSVTVEKYQPQIDAYKKETKAKNVTSPLAFCFLISLRFSGKLFEEAYSFLTEFYDCELQLYDRSSFLNNYFN